MPKSKEQEILNAAAFAGEILLTNGAEIARVEDTVLRFLHSFSIQEANVCVVSDALFITISPESSHSLTVLRNLSVGTVHLGRIEAVNALVRELAEADGTDVDVAMQKLEQCASLPPSKGYVQLAACGLAGAGFCYLTGGSLKDVLCALGIGVLLQLIQLYMQKSPPPFFITSIFGSFFVSSLAFLTYNLGWGDSPAHIITGSIVSLLPGTALTMAVRNFFSGYYLSGYTQLIQVLLKAMCLALGVMVALQMWGPFSGVKGL